MAGEKPRLTLANQTEWSRWLAREADQSDGVMLTLVKKGSTNPTSLTYEEARDEALCHGWIDSTGYKAGDSTYVRRFTPRRPKSVWSKLNIEYVGRLRSEGRMKPRGELEIEKAKADGRWDAAYHQATNVAPPELLAAIAAVPDAQAQWEILTKQNKFTLCFRLASLKTEAGRQKRITTTVDMLARGETPHPQKRKRELVESNGTGAVAKQVKVPAQSKASETPREQTRSSHRRSGRLSAALNGK